MNAQLTASEPFPCTVPNVESNLIHQARAGDPSAQSQLAQKHRQAMYLLALQFLKNHDDAMDTVQDSLLRFFETLHRFDPRRPVRPWLFQIVRNRARDLLRRRKVRKHNSIDERDDEGNLRFELLDPAADPERDTQKIRLKARLWQALDSLSPNQREIIVLRDYQDLAYAEIAATLDIPIGTVMSRLHGARKRLRTVLEESLQHFKN